MQNQQLTEMQIEQIRVLYDLPRDRVFRIKLAAVAAAAQVRAGSLFLVQNQMLSRTSTISSDSRAGLPVDFEQFVARTADVEYRLDGGDYMPLLPAPTPLLLLRTNGERTELTRVQGVVDTETLRRYGGFEGTPAQVSLRVLVILRDCNLKGCSRTGD